MDHRSVMPTPEPIPQGTVTKGSTAQVLWHVSRRDSPAVTAMLTARPSGTYEVLVAFGTVALQRVPFSSAGAAVERAERLRGVGSSRVPATAPGPPDDADQLLKAWSPVTTSLPRILVVQDEPSNLHIAALFCAAGYEVTAVVGAAKGMSVLESRAPFALYVMDFPIPSEGGTGLAVAIRQSQPDARILYLTAFSDALFTLHGRLMPGREELLTKALIEPSMSEGGLTDALRARQRAADESVKTTQ